jgi:hypothetical protein
MFLKHENLRIRPVLLDMEEYRLLNGWSKDRKKGSTRYDRIPSELVEEVEIDGVQDYLQFVPYGLEEPFSVKTFAKAAHIPVDVARVTVHILNYMEVIRQVGKQGNALLYEVTEK